MPFVVDASITATWCFADENNSATNGALLRLASDEAVVPVLWWFEIWNVLIVNECRGRIDSAGSAEFLADLAELPLRVDHRADSETVMALARKHTLTAYDAAYLELAHRVSGPLATLDRALAAAAQAEGLELITNPTM